MHGADGLHTTGSTRAPQPQHTKEAQDTVASRAPQRLIRSTRTSRRAQSHRVPLGRSTQTSRKLHAHAPAPCASRGTAPRARCRVPRCSARRAAPPASPACASRGTGPVSCAALCAGARRVRCARAGLRRAPGEVREQAARARRARRACARRAALPRQSGPCFQPNRMETGARYEYRSLISRISQPTFAKMARSPNFLAQWRRSPGGDGPQIWQSA
jgi:hypothetical protein